MVTFRHVHLAIRTSSAQPFRSVLGVSDCQSGTEKLNWPGRGFFPILNSIANNRAFIYNIMTFGEDILTPPHISCVDLSETVKTVPLTTDFSFVKGSSGSRPRVCKTCGQEACWPVLWGTSYLRGMKETGSGRGDELWCCCNRDLSWI